MFDRNQKILSLIVSTLFVLSGFLFYKSYLYGQQVLDKNILSTQTAQPSILPISSPQEASSTATISAQLATQPSVPVERVVDGDTIEVLIAGKTEKVRLIGVNTPETVDPRRPVQCFGKEASDETKKLLTGKLVILEKDISETDKFDRLLRYVYLPLENGQTLFVNDYLVREGFAQVDTFPPDVKFNNQFLEAQNEARQSNKGLWAKCK